MDLDMVVTKLNNLILTNFKTMEPKKVLQLGVELKQYNAINAKLEFLLKIGKKGKSYRCIN